jgi:apolipoprotein N-acyltransferase
LIVGGVGNTNNAPTNLSILWEPKNGPTNIYIKRHLAPFGEVMPLRSIAEFVSPLAKSVTDFQAGETAKIFNVGDAKISPVICFEILDDNLIRESYGKSNLIVAQTNNATFGESAESDQQLQITRARAIESGRNIVVVSTVGNTAFIDRSGEIISILPKYEAGVLYGEVNLTNENTSALWFSSWVVRGSFVAVFVLLIFSVKRRFFRVA